MWWPVSSAFPLPAEVLTDRVRALAEEIGALPSRRRVMRECRVGQDRAAAALATVGRELLDASRTALHAVPDVDPEYLLERTDQDPDSDDAEGAPDVPVETVTAPAQIDGDGLVSGAVGAAEGTSRGRVPRWPLLVIALGAFVSIWGGWVGLGKFAGFGPVVLLPGIADGWTIDSSITLPLGVEAYAAFAMTAWLSARPVSARARRFARWSALAALSLGVLGQATFHLLVTSGAEHAPGPVVVFVSCLPVVVLGAGAALAHLLMSTDEVTR
jgi:hypothetical protein